MAHGQRSAIAVRLAVVVALMAGLITTVDIGAASADAPTVTISPTVVADGESIAVDIAGFPATGPAIADFLLCDEAIGTPDASADLGEHCGSLTQLVGDPVPTHADVTVRDLSGGSEGFLRCSEPVQHCVIAVAMYDWPLDAQMEIVAFASTPITITPDPWSVSANPDSVAAGDTTQVTTSGFPSGPGVIALCSYSVIVPTTVADVDERCRTVDTYPAGLPPTSDLTVPWAFMARRLVECAGTWYCGVAAYVTGPDGSVAAFAWDPIEVAQSTLHAEPSRNLSDGDVARLTGSGLQPGSATVSQCADDPSTDGVDHCGPATPVTVSGDGNLALDVSIEGTIAGPGGETYPCGYGCVLALFPGDGSPGLSAPAGLGPAAIALVSPDEPIDSGDDVLMNLQGLPGTTAQVAVCALPLGGDLVSSRCNESPESVLLDGGGNGSASLHVIDLLVIDLAQIVSCREIGCAFVAFTDEGDVVASLPFHFRAIPPFSFSLTPAIGLHDGADLSADVDGLRPNSPYQLVPCAPGTGAPRSRCASTLSAPILQSDDSGHLSTTVKALQRFSSTSGWAHWYCRDACTYAIVAGDGSSAGEAGYAMSAPSVSAAPAAGLHDGDTVTVTGTGLQPTYTGPQVLFTTGGWAVAQCSRDVLDDSSLWGVFSHCAVVPGAGPVNVPGTTASAAIEAQSTIHTILGDTVDCTASPDACVVGMTRWEQDATTSTAFAPISFG